MWRARPWRGFQSSSALSKVLWPGGEQMLNLFGHPLCLELPDRVSGISSWHEHIPFAFFALDAVAPRVLVELGTHAGDSYLAFCQGVRASGAPRSEEHTSELQSRRDLVCRLLLEKKKGNTHCIRWY